VLTSSADIEITLAASMLAVFDTPVLPGDVKY